MIITEDELDKLDELLLHLANINEPVDGRDSLGLYYENCTHQPKRLRKLLDEFGIVFSDIYDLFETWYSRRNDNMFDEIKRFADFIHWVEEKHPEIVDEYKDVISKIKAGE